MSGQPTRTPLDVAKFRKEYLATLALQSSINDKNFQANQIFAKTGAPSQPTDTRTTSEKLADLYRLRIELRSRLGEIMSGDNAQNVVEALDDNEARFLAQQIDTIVPALKAQYKLGVPTEVFNQYLQRYMAKYNTTLGVDFGIQQELGQQLLAGQETIMANMPDGTAMTDIIRTVKSLKLSNQALKDEVIQGLEELKTVVDDLPTIFEDISKTENAITRDELLTEINGLVREIPTSVQIQNAMRDIMFARQKGDTALMNDMMSKLNDLVQLGGNAPREIEAINETLSKQGLTPISSPTRTSATLKEPSVMPAHTMVSYYSAYESKSGQHYDYIPPEELRNLLKNSRNEKCVLGYLSVIDDIMKAADIKKRDYIPNVPSKSQYQLNKVDLDQVIDALTEEDSKIRHLFSLVPKEPPTKASAKEPTTTTTPAKEIPPPPVPPKIIPKKSGKGIRMSGRGIAIDYSAGIQSEPDYVPFGKFIVNRKRLGEGILMIKRVGGNFIPEMKTKRISSNLTTIFKKVAGGSLPSFGDLEKLNDDEREYLRFIATKSNLSSKLEIPAPKKDPNDALINQFEIMRGEIIAGNDSKELVRKFKRVLLDMIDKDLLPKGQAKDILVELAKRDY